MRRRWRGVKGFGVRLLGWSWAGLLLMEVGRRDEIYEQSTIRGVRDAAPGEPPRALRKIFLSSIRSYCPIVGRLITVAQHQGVINDRW
jgi:hypothetical protein